MLEITLTAAEGARGLVALIGLTIASNLWLLLPLLVVGGILLTLFGVARRRRRLRRPGDVADHFPVATTAQGESDDTA